MGNGGSHTQAGGAGGAVARQPAHWHHSLPSDPVLKASHLKVLPDIDTNPRLRSTNNGAILQSGGTISGRRPLSLALPHDRDPSLHNGVYRSKSISQDYETERPSRFSYLSNQRDPLHRSHTHLHLDQPEETFEMQSKRFGSEPDLRNSQETQTKTKITNKNLKKKYKAPPPPPHIQNDQGGSSPDSWKAQQSYEPPQAPSRKLRLFKTRAETKKNVKHNHDNKGNGFIRHSQPMLKPYEQEDIRPYPNDIFEPSRFPDRDKMLRSPTREKEEYLKYPSSREDDMVQTQMSLKREENILQTAFSRQEQLRSKHSQQNMYRGKAKANELKTDMNKAFRSSERFKKQSIENDVLRREKSFDNSLIQDAQMNGVNRMHLDRKTLLEDQRKFNGREESPVEVRLKDRLEDPKQNNRKSAPQNPIPNGVASAEFQAELIMATRKLRSVSRDTTDSVKNQEKTETKNSTNRSDKRVSNPVSKTNGTKEKTSNRREIEKTETKVNSGRTTNRTSMVTLDRSKQIKTKERTPRIIHEEKKEEMKSIPKINGTKVLPVEKNNRNRRESRQLDDRGQASGKESTPEQSPSRVKQDSAWDKNQQNQPSKSFYFGMDKNELVAEEEEMGVHEKVRRHLEMSYNSFPKANGYQNEEKPIKNVAKNDYNTRLELPPGSPESALSSEPEMDDPMSEENNPHGIALQLRPTLPKKQLEIPRFSPAAAWRLLAALETETESTATPVVEETSSPAEERIRKSSRNALTNAPRAPRSHDKSGDSGISGDAGPPNDDCIDTPTTPSSPVRKEESSKRPLITTWTPQQDLEEESSSDAGVDSPHSANTDSAPAKFSARQQVFSLSLPRETHLNHLEDKNKQFQQPFNSLQKLRKSVSGAIGVALGAKKPDADLEETSAEDEQADNNWFLSRSAPNSLNNGLNSQNLKLSTSKSHDSGQHQTPPSSDQEDERLPPVMPSIMRPQPPFSYLASGGHVMYLPQYNSQRALRSSDQSADQPFSMSYDGKEGPYVHREKPIQKSDGEMEEIDSDKDKYDPYPQGRLMSRSKSSGELVTSRSSNSSKPKAKGKRFTFQSTVRQIERRRLSEKLSREAETKEKQRLSELEAMRRVEEEFQRKRAREKASIRQQLRLVSLDESCSSLPSSWGAQGRSEPEGAVSASPSNGPSTIRHGRSSDASSSSLEGGGAGSGSGSGVKAARAPATRVLSEFRQATREYRDYRRTPTTPALHPHPPACYNMPRATHTTHRTAGGWAAEAANDSDNYRREFARGRRAPSSSGSDLSQGGRLLTPPRW
ncbi:uncharacterized protein LOC143915135 [Arctopsyche grandis]|uniref:uncharacterized protein LOC143915135 n=1 Tax=Arctopsyche grandis TaxID=121162 RepID=UPI00406D6CFF